MDITITGTQVEVTGNPFIGFAVNNNVNRLSATTDKDETWEYQLVVFMVLEEKFNVINMTREGNNIYVDLTRDMLPYGGKYIMQFVAYKQDQVDHTESFSVWVNPSLDTDKMYDPIPSEFYQMEQRIRSMLPVPTVNDNGKVLTVEDGKYVLK